MGAIGRVPETGQAGNPLGDAVGGRSTVSDAEGARHCVGSRGRQVHSVRGWDGSGGGGVRTRMGGSQSRCATFLCPPHSPSPLPPSVCCMHVLGVVWRDTW
jgi:hypothetical protein